MATATVKTAVLVCDTVHSGKNLPKFRTKLLPRFQRSTTNVT